jgi:hypothetical protein
MSKSNPRAVRYRKLALAERDREKADLLYKLAEEADRGLLCTAEWMSVKTPSVPSDLKTGDKYGNERQ